MTDQTFLVTKSFIETNCTERGGWTKAQILALGIEYPQKQGWKRRIVNTYITEKQKKEFIEGKSITVNKSNMDHTHRILTYAKFIQNNSNHITDEARAILNITLNKRVFI